MKIIQTIASVASICFCVYGVIVFSRWHSIAEKTNIMLDELWQEMKEDA